MAGPIYVDPNPRFKLGALKRDHDPNEDKWSLRARPLSRVTRIEADEILPTNCLVDVVDQGQMGSCAAVSAERAAAMARMLAGGPRVDLHWTWLYFWSRANTGIIKADDPSTWYDSGSYVYGALDLLKVGAPPLSSYRYVEDAKWRPAPEIEQAERFDYVFNYAPFYPKSEGLESVWTALQAKMPIVFSMYWPDAYFDPVGPGRCVLPENIPTNQQTGGHAILIRGGVLWNDQGTPKRGAIAQNQWSRQWCPNAAEFGHTLRPGEFVIPESVISNHVFAADAASFEPFTPTPEPQPEPTINERDIRLNELDAGISIAQGIVDGYDADWRNKRRTSYERTMSKYERLGAVTVRNAIDTERRSYINANFPTTQR